MRGFDVLAKDLDLFKSHFLEASAGTGKTFAIEHIVLRLLIEEFTIDQILVVTFTKAAVFDLKKRIRKTLEKALRHVSDAQIEAYPFLENCDDTALFLIKKKLKRALALFDEAKIMTIHSFCNHCLLPEMLEIAEEKMGEDFLAKIMKDYLRTHVHLLPPFQIDKLLRKYHYDLDLLAKDLSSIAIKRAPIECGKSYEDLQSLFSSQYSQLKEKFSLESDKLLEDLLLHAACFRDMCNRKKEVKKEVVEELKRLSQFDSNLSNYSLLQEMQERNRLPKKTPPQKENLHYPHLFEEMQKTLFPILEDVQDTLHIFAYLAEEARKYLKKEKDLFFHDDLLHLMEERVKDAHFAEKIRDVYKAVLIDEFQDTDLIQWKIFSTLFLHEDFKGPLYLIGDPKQSIYRFRGADIYTYFQAKKRFPQECQYTLTRNFRSDPKLVFALNHLLGSLTPFITLPKTQEILDCPQMDYDTKKTPYLWNDGKGSIHFLMGNNESDFFPIIVDEIRRLTNEKNIPLKECAILVKDRFQAERFQKYARKRGLHTTTKKAKTLIESHALQAFQELLEGLFQIKAMGAIEKILGGAIFGFSYLEISLQKEKWLLPLCALKTCLEKEGVLPFFHKLMFEMGLYTDILSREEGIEFYADFLKLVEILAEHVSDTDGYLTYLQNLSSLSPDCELIQSYPLGLEDGVPIMTIHGSKGLEFDIVFALGLSLSAKEKRELLFDAERHRFTFSEEMFEQEKKESYSEKIRLLYVASTRAKKRLYLPYLQREDDSPLSLFLKEKKMESELITNSFCVEKSDDGNEKILIKKPNLYTPKRYQFSFSPIHISSFSQLVQTHQIHDEVLERPEKGLPSNKVVGNLLHKLLQYLPLHQRYQSASDLHHFIKPFLENTPFKDFRDEIADILFKALHAPLPVKPSFTLSEVDDKKVLREMEFLYFIEEKNCFLKGFIDCIFEHDHYFYFLDWKTNYLGSSPQDYDKKNIENVMRKQNYFLQEQIYRTALKKYLSIISSQSTLNSSLYIFLRGLILNNLECIKTIVN